MMYRLWNLLRVLCKDVFWLLLGLAILFFVFMVARDVWNRTNPVMKRVVPQVEVYKGITNYFKEVGTW